MREAWDANKEALKQSFRDGAVAFPRLALKTAAWTVGIAAGIIVLIVGLTVANGHVWVVGGPEGRDILDMARNTPPTLEAATPALNQADIDSGYAAIEGNRSQPTLVRQRTPAAVSSATKSDYFDCLNNTARGVALSLPTGDENRERFNLPQRVEEIVEDEAIVVYVAAHCQEDRPPKGTQSGSPCMGQNLRYWYQRGGVEWDAIAATFALNICQPRVSFE